jgi:lipid-binding SYLF domain-containing protein
VRSHNHLPLVCAVTDGGPAAAAGVRYGDVVVALQSSCSGQSANEPPIRVESYDHLFFVLLPAARWPVTLTLQRAWLPRARAGVVNFRMEDELSKACGMVARMTDPYSSLDAAVPRDILRRAQGLAFLRVAKVGFGVSVRVGTGVVVARLASPPPPSANEKPRAESATQGMAATVSSDGEGRSHRRAWSGPLAVGTCGVGVGLQAGAELTDCMLVLNTRGAVEAFASGSQVSLGGSVGVAAGPLGRNVGVAGNLHTTGSGGGGALRGSRAAEGVNGSGGGEGSAKGYIAPLQVAACYAYSHSKVRTLQFSRLPPRRVSLFPHPSYTFTRGTSSRFAPPPLSRASLRAFHSRGQPSSRGKT